MTPRLTRPLELRRLIEAAARTTRRRPTLYAAQVTASNLLWFALLGMLSTAAASIGLFGNVADRSIERWLILCVGALAIGVPALLRVRRTLRAAVSGPRPMESVVMIAAGFFFGTAFGSAALLDVLATADPRTSYFVAGHLMAVLTMITTLTAADRRVYAAASAPVLAIASIRMSQMGSRVTRLEIVGALSFLAVMAIVHLVGARLHDAWFTQRADHEQLVVTLQQQAAQSERRHDDLRREHDQVVEQSRRDDLTGVASRRTFLEAVSQNHGRLASPFALAILDIDHFKAVNDTYGHLTGDEVLRSVVAAILRALPERAVLGRLGGEEFGVLMPDVDEAAALSAMDAVRREVYAAVVIPATEFPVAVSIGVVEGGRGQSIPTLLGDADRALYRAKDAGRNRVARASENPVETYPPILV